MKTRLLGAVVCVMIMLACPVLCMASDAAKNSDGYVTVKIDGLQNAAAEDIFNYGGTNDNINTFIMNQICGPLAINNVSMLSLTDISSEYSDFNYEAGRSTSVKDDRDNVTVEFYNISFRFSIVLRNDTSGPLYIIDTRSGYSGDGIVKMIDTYDGKVLDKGDTVSIEGKVTVVNSLTYDGTLFKNGSGTLYAKKCLTTYKEECSHDVTVKIKNDSAFSDRFESKTTKIYETQYDIVNGTESTYAPGKWEMRNDSYEMNASTLGTKTFDGKTYGYKLASEHESMNTGQYYWSGELPGVVSVECTCNNLKMLVDYDNENAIANKLSSNGGKMEHTSGFFDEVYGTVKRTLGIGFNSDYPLWTTVALIVILAIVAGAIGYKLYVKKEQ